VGAYNPVKRIAPTVKSRLGILLFAVSAAACALDPSTPRPPAAYPAEALGPAEQDPVEPGASSEPPPTSEPVDVRALRSGAEPLPADPPFVDFPVPGHPDAVVGLPEGATSPRPVIVVIHGLGGRPDPNCKAWRAIVRGWGFVLCPRGEYDPQRSAPGDRRYTHPGGDRLLAHIDAALEALAERYAGYADVRAPVLAGFSLGASEVASLGQRGLPRFPRLAVLEGGLDGWYAPTVEAFASEGGVRVLFGCGSSWCPPSATAAAVRIAQRPGVEARVASAPVGHANTPPLQEAIRAELPWFLAGDDRWTPAL
jgi:dienelactone hydrolase